VKKTISMLKQESGVALMMAIASVTLLMVIATEVMYETGVELVVSSQAVNQLKAHYAAKAGVQLSLLRIHAYKKAAAMAGSQVPTSMLDPIWQMPFAWPPVLPEDTSAVEKDQVQAAVKASKMQGNYFVTIESEGGKLDVNDLASPSKVIADSTRQQLLQMVQSKMENDETFAEKNRGLDFSKVLDNITDWIDEDKTQKSGSGDESALYPDRGTNEFIPPNSAFKTLEELHMVAGMTDELYDLLAPRLTVFGTKGVNVNYAAKDVLMGLSPQITEERASRIIEDRAKPERGPFKDENDFIQYLGTIGITGNPFKGENDQTTVPLLFGSEFNFRIRSTGRAGRVQREITAVTYDFDRVKDQLKKNMPTPTPTPPDPNAPPPTATPTATPGGNTSTPAKVPNEQPNIVYWNET
jgi:general secretion pathway protein K